MAGLAPAIHALLFRPVKEDVDARHKAGHDGKSRHSAAMRTSGTAALMSTAMCTHNVTKRQTCVDFTQIDLGCLNRIKTIFFDFRLWTAVFGEKLSSNRPHRNAERLEEKQRD
jgi:hypothetical protein